MLPLLCLEPGWKRTNMYRLGAEYRTTESRFIHIDKLGWFVHLRDEFHSVSGLTASSGIAGPFLSQAQANAYLQYAIHRVQSSETVRP